jgi:chemotaxis protein histidine kinase CheA
MKGRIEVESQPGKGTCFIVRLPAEPVAESAFAVEGARETVVAS